MTIETHKTKGRKRALTWIIVLALIVVGVQLVRTNDRAEANPRQLTYLEPATFTTLYPPSVGYYPNGGIANNITDRLLYQDPETLELYPWIATDLPEVNADATEYTFHIRQGVTYSDGSVLDAANVAKNFDLYGKGDKARKFTVSEQISNYDHSEVIDPYTVKFYFTAPSPGFAQATSTMNSGLLSSATLDKNLDGFGPGKATEVIGSGPFVITEEEINHSLTLTARKDYNWAPPRQKHEGPALVDSIKIIITPEASVREGALIAGQADIARDIEAPVEQHLLDNGLGITAASTKGVVNSLAFRFRRPELSDIRVRQAILHAIDRQKLVTTLFSSSYPVATSVLAHDALGYENHQDELAFDPQESARLLDEAGWVPGEDGIRTKDGLRLSFTINYAEVQPRSREVITFVQSNLRDIGVEINLLPGDKATQNAAVKDSDKVQIMHTMVGRADYDVIKSHLYSTTRNSLLNYDSATKTVGDPTLQELLEKVSDTPDEQGRAQAVKDVQSYVIDQSYLVPLFEEPQVYGTQSVVHDFQTEAVGRPWFYNVWLAR